ncbi:MAG: septum formation initiator family protein [Acidobacteriota bacterium]
MKLRPRRSLWLLGPLLASLVFWGWWKGTVRMRETRRELAQLEARKERLEIARRSLAREVEALRHEREARARSAREVLDVVAPGEVLVVLPAPTPGAGTRGPAAGEPVKAVGRPGETPAGK